MQTMMQLRNTVSAIKPATAPARRVLNLSSRRVVLARNQNMKKDDVGNYDVEVKTQSESATPLDKFVNEAGNPNNEANEKAAKPGVSVQPGEAMTFAGPAPERINSRLAMLGVFFALLGNLTTGRTVAQQFIDRPVIIAISFITIAVATLIPMVRGESMNKENGIWTVEAEIVNGRWAMLGFLAWIATEGLKGGPLVHF